MYDVDDETLESLDAIEGYPDFYDKATVNTSEGKAIIYHLPVKDAAGESTPYLDYPENSESNRIFLASNNLTWI